ncbi:threonine synthase [Helicobacter sp. 13S00477-4]|uniref:threonine synthase n=1 Tax=Helicobacter sp. 13S00477-4 TaxID=1905759 RepID=UPI000BA78112|nr:threonine synthase [Helicobacter sp. 13S00477-4]PAF52534.1 threonine synthase [Helicobacter sp. 13S00477-4]
MNNFIQTRGNDNSRNQKASFEEVILNPNASFGGLYTLEKLPQIDFKPLLNLNYSQLSEKIFDELQLTLDKEILQEALKSYETFDNPKNPAPLIQTEKNIYFQELYHGPTRAFKDMALQPFGIIFSKLAQNKNKKYLILTATSGDTGPATLQTFANQADIFVLCLYPKGGTSDVQELQMITQEAKNLKILGIKGDFDTAQNILKSLLKDEDFKKALEAKNFSLSAANSVNFGRIAFQIIYHIWGYLTLVRDKKIPFGQKIYIVIPSGNFGNALGAFYAKMMGLPIEKIIIASNPNNILTEFIQTGIYNIKDKTLIKSYSPAMDILKSSNIERLLFALFGASRTKELMQNLEENSFYKLKPKELSQIQSHFLATFCDDKGCLQTIKESFEKGYLIDPHTATGLKAAKTFCEDTPIIICSTAEWSKFAPTVIQAIFEKQLNDKEAINMMQKQKDIQIHPFIKNLFSKPIVHTEVLDKDKIKSSILNWLE